MKGTMTDITKYRNVSLTHETYKTLIALSKVLLPDATLSISKTIESIANEIVSKVVPPEEAARAARADAKRRELILLEQECEKERLVEEEHLRILEEKRREAQIAAGRVGRAQNELEDVRDASLQWAGRQAYMSR